MSAEEFRANVESAEVPVDCHYRVLRIASIYLNEGLYDDGVFSVVNNSTRAGGHLAREI